MQFSVCPECQDAKTPFSFYFQNDKWDVHAKCRGCGWKSAWVMECHYRKHFFSLTRGLPNVFWHAYLPSQALQ